MVLLHSNLFEFSVEVYKPIGFLSMSALQSGFLNVYSIVFQWEFSVLLRTANPILFSLHACVNLQNHFSITFKIYKFSYKLNDGMFFFYPVLNFKCYYK